MSNFIDSVFMITKDVYKRTFAKETFIREHLQKGEQKANSLRISLHRMVATTFYDIISVCRLLISQSKDSSLIPLWSYLELSLVLPLIVLRYDSSLGVVGDHVPLLSTLEAGPRESWEIFSFTVPPTT